MKLVLPVVLCAICLGCGREPAADAPGATEPAAANGALSIEGPGGTVALGDSLEDAQAAFPAPEDAMLFENSLNFAILGVQGWAWAVEEEGRSFEVALEEGRIVAIAYTAVGDVDEGRVASEKQAHGEPTASAETDAAALLVWERGDNARFLLVLFGTYPMGQPAAMTLIGDKERMKLLGFDHANPQALIDMMSMPPPSPDFPD